MHHVDVVVVIVTVVVTRPFGDNPKLTYLTHSRTIAIARAPQFTSNAGTDERRRHSMYFVAADFHPTPEPPP